MMDSMLLVGALVLCLAGCILLALSQQRNWRSVSGDRNARPPRTAGAGWLLVLAALVPCVLRDGGSFAALVWPLVFAAAAMTTAMILAYRPAWLKFVPTLLSRAN